MVPSLATRMKEMKKTRILHFELDGTRGGIESFLFNLYSQADKDKFQFEFVTTAISPALSEELLNLGGIIHHISPYKNLLSYTLDIEKLLLADYDVVHIHKNSATNIIPIILCKRHHIPKIIVHSHNTSPSIGGVTNILHQVNKEYLNRNVTARFACSKEAGKWMFGRYDYQIMSNGILTKNFLFKESVREQKRRELHIPDDMLVIGHVGRFTKQKNHKFLFDIFESVVKGNTKAKLLLIGEGDLQDEMREVAEKRKLDINIIFAGLRKDIPELMMAMDVFVMPSLYEGLPIVGIEAQASGLPILLADTISEDTEITDGVTWFSLNDEVEHIAELILKNQFCSKDIRLKRNELVRKAGYDMIDTCKRLCDYYESKSNEEK